MRASALVATTAAYAGFGPPLGLLVVLVGALLYGVATDQPVGNMLPAFLPPVLIFLLMPLAFRFGSVPAVSTGLVVAVLAHKQPRLFFGQPWKRAVLTAVIGASIGALWGLFSRRHFMVHQQIAAVGLDLLTDGIVAGVPAALIGLFFPKRAWLGVSSDSPSAER